MTSQPTKCKASVLLIDDDAAVLRSLDRELSIAGYRVATASSGTEALQKYAQSVPDVIVLDYEFPAQNGTHLTRDMLQIASRPIVMLSGDGDEGRVRSALGSGAAGFVVKPVAANQLIPVITTALAQQSMRVGVESTEDRFGLSLDELGEVINSISFGMMVIDQQRQLIHSNAAGDRLIMDGQFLKVVNNKLCAADSRQSAALNAFVNRCFDKSRVKAQASSDEPFATCLVELADELDSGKCLLWSNRMTKARPANDEMQVPIRDTVTVLAATPNQLATTDAGADDAPRLYGHCNGGVFKEIYGLSEKENDLAIALINGATIDSFAAAKCRSVHTIRNQLKSLFRKTDTHRQADLVRLLTRINTLIRPVQTASK